MVVKERAMTLDEAHRKLDALATDFANAERTLGPAHSHLWDGPLYERFNAIANALDDAGITYTYGSLWEYFCDAVQALR